MPCYQYTLQGLSFTIFNIITWEDFMYTNLPKYESISNSVPEIPQNLRNVGLHLWYPQFTVVLN